MARKSAPTPADHARFSRLVETLEVAYHELSAELWRAYPKSARAVRSALAISRALTRIKADLEDRSCNEMPKALWGTDIYYGPPERRQAARARLAPTTKGT
jgi:hypothetical protein